MNKKIASIALILIFILAMVPSIAFSEDRSYTINKADIQLFVQSDGLLHVKESLYYSFEGQYNGVYRDIPLRSDQSINNIKVSTKGAYSSFEVYTEGDVKKIKVFLYSDPGKTRPISDRDVEIIIEYDFVNAINIYDDVGELHYKIWGEYWDVEVGELTSTIHFNSSIENIKFWLNPMHLPVENSTNNSTLILKTDHISPGNYFEIRAAIPLSNFENPVYANKINRNGLAEMEKIQKEYADDFAFKQAIYPIIAFIIVLLSILIPISIYLKNGLGPKIEYHGEYERELPYNDPPAFVNAVTGFNNGKPSLDGFQATIMDLINRKVLSIVPKETKDETLKIKINEEVITNENLYKFELSLINFLKKGETDNVVDLEELIDDLEPNDFSYFFEDWKDDFKNQFLDENTHKKFYSENLFTFSSYGFIALAVSIIGMIILAFIGEFHFVWSILFALIIVLIIGVICIILSVVTGESWTKHGKEYDKKWKNFKKYLTDFSLIKEYPPESVAVWNHYLVYATALGVADKVKEAMKIHLPAESLDRDYNSAYHYHHYGGYALMSAGLSSAMDSGSSSSSDGGGSVGGGSGGGGGGAF